MTPHLTICYLTSRKEPKIEWFFQSLRNQLTLDCDNISIVVVDFYHPTRAGLMIKNGQLGANVATDYPVPVETVCVKPTVWQGEHRLTKEDWFAASNARNTGLCLAPDGYIAFVDDLSVLMPGWLRNVRQAINWNGITLGAYKKVKNLVVEDGVAKSWDEFKQGIDSRLSQSTGKTIPCGGEWLFGCSLVAPVESLLTVGGFPEFCDGMGFEDSIMGLALQNAGFHFQYCPSMLTLESDELHSQLPVMKRSDYGVSPLDKSHSALNIVQSGCKYFENYYEGGIRKMREEVLSGKPFPVVGNPKNEWYTGKLLSEL